MEDENPSNQHQVSYAPVSKGPSGFTLVPKNVAEPLREALARIAASTGGDLDEFVRKELQYDSKDDLFKSFSAEQIDALAMSLYNMKNGKGMIIGDMTGIGKGRVVAGIIRHTLLNNKVPIFITEKPKLFSDMWRDLVDIKTEGDVKPLLMASDDDGHIVDANSNIIQKKDGGTAKSRVLYQQIATQGKAALEAKDRNAVFVTYSQFNLNGVQRQVIAALAPDSVMILDEAHNAGGSDATPTLKNPDKVSTAQFIRSADVLGAASGVIYSSATFAKRPDNMPLYFRTALGESGMSPEQLTDAMNKGGVALQQFISAALTKAGDMIRREQDFSKIARFERKVITADKKRVYDRSDTITEQMRDMGDFQTEMAEHFPWDEVATENGQEVSAGEDGSNVSSTGFNSGLHNLVSQMQLSLKADAIVKEALTALDEGYKPVIGLMNTMESFLKEYAEQSGLKKGDAADFTFNDVLVKMLNNALRYNVRDARGTSSKHYATEDQLERHAPDMYERYITMKGILMALDLSDMPASPIDYIKQKVSEAGHTVREITGRGIVIAADKDGNNVLMDRDDKDRNTSVNGYNNGPVSALVINRAGATGLSLHPTEKTGDKRPRRMIIAQADLNIDTFIQMLGRIFRKGQIHDPEYIMLSTALPSETRPAIVVEKKMQSMNANTSASDKSGFSSDIPDMVNQYGDQVVKNWLHNNFNFATALGTDPDKQFAHGELFKQVSGRMGLMAADDQESFWAEVVDDYKTLIAEKDALGQNDLVAKDYDFQAITKKKTVIHQGTDESNPFTSSAAVEEVSVLSPGKSYTAEEVQGKIDKSLDGREAFEYKMDMREDLLAKGREFEEAQQKIIDKVNTVNPELDDAGEIKDVKLKREMTRAENAQQAVRQNMEAVSNLIDTVDLGRVYSLPMGDGEHILGVPYEIKFEKGNGNPLAPSRIKVMYAIPNGNKSLAIGMNRTEVWREAEIQHGTSLKRDWDDLDAGDVRRTRHIITGNVLQGYSALQTRAQLVNFTRENGTTDQGILLPINSDVGRLTSQETADATAATAYLSGGQNRTVVDRGNGIFALRRGPDVVLRTPGAKSRAGKFFLDKPLISITGDFRKSSGLMTAVFPMDMAQAALTRLQELGSRFTIDKIELPRATGTPRPGSGPMLSMNPMADPENYKALAKSMSDFASASVAPKVREAGNALLDYAKKARDKVAPTVFNPNAKNFAVEMNRVYGNLSRNLDVVVHAAEEYSRMFDKMPHSEKMDFMAAMHNGLPIEPELQPVAEFVNAVNRQLMEQLHAVAPDILPQLRENYFTAIFKPSASREKVTARIIAKTPWEGGKGFTMKRVWDDVREAEAAGLKLVSDNPMEILALHVADVQKTTGCRTVFAMLKPKGDIIFVGARQKAPEGFTDINDRVATEYRNSIPAWKVVEMTAKKTLRPLAIAEFGKELFENPEMNQEANDLRWTQADGSDLNIHGMHNGTGKSYTQLVMEKMLNEGQQHFAEIAPNIARKVLDLADTIPEVKNATETPKFENQKLAIPVDGRIILGKWMIKSDIAPVLNNFLSRSIYSKEFGAPLRGLRSAGNVLNMFQLVGFFHANFVARDMWSHQIAVSLDDAWRAATGQDSWEQAAKSVMQIPFAPYTVAKKGATMIKAWNVPGSQGAEAEMVAQLLASANAKPHMDSEFQTNNVQKTKEDIANGKVIATAYHGFLAAPEVASHLLQNVFVPNAKTGLMSMYIENMLRQHPGWTAEQKYRAANDICTLVDASAGQVHYDRLYMDKTCLNLAQLSMRSPGWNGGSWHIALRMLPDTYQFTKEWVKTGKPPEHLPRTVAYTIGMVIGTMVANLILTEMLAKDKKLQFMDLFAWRSGNLDAHGRDERFLSPTYIKDTMAWWKDFGGTAMHKLHPIIGLAEDLRTNHDYRNVEIRQRDDSKQDQAMSMLKYVGEAYLPFMIKNMQVEAKRSGTLTHKLLPMIGEVPSSDRFMDTPFEAYAHGIASDKGSMTVRTTAEANRSDLKRQIANEIKRDGKSPTAVTAYQAGKITIPDLKSAVKTAGTAPVIRALNSLGTISELTQGWEKAGDQERAQILVPLAQKANRLFLATDGENRPAALEMMKQLGTSIQAWSATQTTNKLK